MSWDPYVFPTFYLFIITLVYTPYTPSFYRHCFTDPVYSSLPLVSSSFWFSYIFFQIFLWGMLVLSIYGASPASDEIFKVSPLSVIANWRLMFMPSSAVTLTDPLFNPSTVSAQHHFLDIKNQVELSALQTHSMCNFPAMALTLFVVLYLLLT